jgi:deoxyadenosine/deoxycytidine kinase
MQLHLLNVRYRMHMNAQWHSMSNNNSVVLDRSYFGDTAFARLQVLNKSMTEDEYNTYSLAYHNMTSNVLLPNICIYLDIKPEISAKRINKRMEIQTGRKCEDVIDIKYLEMLEIEELKVVNVLEKQGVYVLRIDWNEDLNEEQIKEKIKNIVNIIKEYDVPDLLLDYHRKTL